MQKKILYLLHVWGDVEPNLLGSYDTDDRRDEAALRIRAEEGEDCGGLYPVTLTLHGPRQLVDDEAVFQYDLEVDSYSGYFFDSVDNCDTCGAPPGETHPNACADAIEREAASHE